MRRRVDPTANSRPRYLPAQLLGVGLVLIGAAALGATPPTESPLDSYPGFARTPESAVRDDTIAYWEAYNRELSVAECMKGAGFEYRPAAAFPEEAVAAIAEGLGVSTDVPDAISPFEWNASYAANLSTDDREEYSQALSGESAQDVAAAAQTERIPQGRGANFGRGGCIGVGDAAGPSIWDLPRLLAGEIDEARTSAGGPEVLSAAEDEYHECATKTAGLDVSGPMELDAALASGAATASSASAIRAACDGILAELRQAAEADALVDVRNRHAAEFSEVSKRYDGVLDAIRADGDFLRYLAENASLAEAEGAADADD
jgi:hypothetical protein